MRRDVLLNALERVLRDIGELSLVERFGVALDAARKEGENSLIKLLPALHEFSLRAIKYDEAEKTILDKFGLSGLIDPQFWVLLAQEKDPGPLFSSRRIISNFVEYTPRIIELIRIDRLEFVRRGAPDAPDFLKGKELLTLILPETDTQFSSPSRFLYAIESIQLMYSTVASVLNLSDSDISIISCDSGSDKSFDFTGIPQIIQGVKDIILSLWDRVVLRQHQHSRASLDTIAHGLPIMEKISQMEADGLLQPEMAEQLRRNALKACLKFLDAGATTFDLETQPRYSPRSLMAPEVKLLAAPHLPTQVEPVSTSDVKERPSKIDSSEDTTSEAEELRKLVEYLQRQISQDTKNSPRRRVSSRKKGDNS